MYDAVAMAPMHVEQMKTKAASILRSEDEEAEDEPGGASMSESDMTKPTGRC